MLDKNKKIELQDYFDTFGSEEMEEVIRIAKEIAEKKHQAEYENDLCAIVAHLGGFIKKYGYLDFDFDGDTTGIGFSAILSTNTLKPNTICVRYSDEKELKGY